LNALAKDVKKYSHMRKKRSRATDRSSDTAGKFFLRFSHHAIRVVW
jgi:hypothetical protein